MKRINLLPKSQQREVSLLLFSKKLESFWVWVFMSLLLFFVLSYITKSLLVIQGEQIDAQIGLDKEVLKSADNEVLREQVSELNSEIKSIQNLNAQHYHWSVALKELGNLLPSDVQVSLLSFDRTTGKVEIQGKAGKRDSVLKFWSDIHKSVYFQDINFPLGNLDSASDTDFSFIFYVKPEALK